MIFPFTRMSIKSVLWYQGESNSYKSVWKDYACQFPLMIRAWREGMVSWYWPKDFQEYALWVCTDRSSQLHDGTRLNSAQCAYIWTYPLGANCLSISGAKQFNARDLYGC